MNIPDGFLTELSERLGNQLLALLEEAGQPELLHLAQCALWATLLAGPPPGMRTDAAAWLEESLQLLDG